MRADVRGADAAAAGGGRDVTAVGLFAGRGDVILAMGMALVLGVLLGYQLRRLVERCISWRRR